MLVPGLISSILGGQGVVGTTQSTAVGTLYSLTAVAAAVTFGTTSPNITLLNPGTYLVLADMVLNCNAATFAAVRTATMKLRRTNNTPADLTNSARALKTQIITALTYSMGQVTCWDMYTTQNSNDAIALFGSLDVVPSAGSLDVASANLIALKLN